MRFRSLFSVLAVLAAGVTSTSIQFTGTTLELGGIPYYIPPDPVSQLDVGWDVWKFAKENALEFIPFTVVSENESRALASTFGGWKVKDDVWSESFLMGIATQDENSISSSVRSTYDVKFVFESPSAKLPSGPYFLSPLTDNVHQAYRLYSDEYQSFVYGVVPTSNGSYRQLSAHVDGADTPTVGVPSRLYYTPTPAQPFSGYRFAVKDIYDIAGLKTGCGNRAYYQIYPAKNATAFSIQRLLDSGMVLVGKVKASQFAAVELATDDWVDYHAPYNPRGDGYQDASSSSTGPGAALAAYSWLDFTVGSDTGSSMRGPAGKCGLYGNRPTHGAISLSGVMPLSPAFDTAGIFARDAVLWAQAGKLWYPNLTDYTMYPKRVIVPTDAFGSNYTATPPVNGTADATLDMFLKKLEGFLSVKRTDVNLTTFWAETRPSNVSASSFTELLNTTFWDILTVDQANLLGKFFYQDYGALYDGRRPFVDPSPLARWTYGFAESPALYQQAVNNKNIFETWIASQVLRGNQTDTCSDAILVYPQSVGTTTYRNAYISGPTLLFGWTYIRLAIYSEVPDFVVPVGEQAYNSTITNKTEYLPITMSLVAAKNCDFMLFNLISDLQKQGILTTLNTGSRVF